MRGCRRRGDRQSPPRTDRLYLLRAVDAGPRFESFFRRRTVYPCGGGLRRHVPPDLPPRGRRQARTDRMSFVHLHTHSEFSLLDGASRISEMVRLAAETGMPAIALTDHGVLYGAVDLYLQAKAAGIKPIIGQEAYVATRSRLQKEGRAGREPPHPS